MGGVDKGDQLRGGVDKGDQLRGYYKVRLKSIKNYKYIFWFLFDVCITNAYILSRYNVNSQQPLPQSLKNFRLKLATQLIGTYKSRKRAGRPSSAVTQLLPPTLPRLDHLPARGDISRRCTYCQKIRVPSRRRSSIWVCSACLEKPHLCLKEDCYKLWHENNFTQ